MISILKTKICLKHWKFAKTCDENLKSRTHREAIKVNNTNNIIIDENVDENIDWYNFKKYF